MQVEAGDRRKAAVGVASAAAAMLLIAGCGGSDPNSASSGTSNPGSGGAAAVASSLDDACTKGGEEGKLIIRKTTDPDDFAKEIAPFEQKYPDIKVAYQSMRPEDSVQRIFASHQAGKQPDADVIDMDLPSLQPLLAQGLVQKVAWRDFGFAEDLVFTTSDGIELPRSQRTILGLGYNPKNVDAAELPNTWEELNDSKWKGKVITDPRGKYLSGIALTWGADKATDWFTRFVEVDKPMVVEGATTSLEKVISGEALLSTSAHDAEVAEQKAKGAPVEIKYLDVVPTQEHYGAVVEDAADPNAAACFIGWWSDPNGGGKTQLQYEFKNNETRPAAVPADAQLAIITDPKQVGLQTDVANKFGELLTNK